MLSERPWRGRTLRSNETKPVGRISHPLEIVNEAPHFLLLALRSVNQRPAIGEQNMNIGTRVVVGADVLEAFLVTVTGNTKLTHHSSKQKTPFPNGNR